MAKKRIIMIIALTLVVAVISFFCVACFREIPLQPIPKGYSYGVGTGPVEYQEYNNFYVHRQFPDENGSYDREAKRMYFIYNDELFYMKSKTASSVWDWFDSDNFSIYKNSENEHIGDIDIQQECYYDAIFLSKNHLYYAIRRIVTIRIFTISTEGFVQKRDCNKYEYCRYNINNGQNEIVSLDDFMVNFNLERGSFRLSE